MQIVIIFVNFSSASGKKNYSTSFPFSLNNFENTSPLNFSLTSFRFFYSFQVKLEGRTQFLSAVCMTCLEGWGAGRRLRCLYCATPWDGSSLVIGTMYSYDIFAAMPCCTERLRVRIKITYNVKTTKEYERGVWIWEVGRGVWGVGSVLTVKNQQYQEMYSVALRAILCQLILL